MDAIRSRRFLRLGILLNLLILSVLLIVIPALLLLSPKFVYIPGDDDVLPALSRLRPQYDLWGHPLYEQDVARLLGTEEGSRMLLPENGAVRINRELIRQGRRAFYGESFGSEALLTDVIRIFNGGLGLSDFLWPLIRLWGQGTANLQIRTSRAVRAGDRVIPAGTRIDTGLDVPRGSFLPLGITVEFTLRGARVGATCALCHSTVDRATGRIIEGSANSDLNAGLLLALAGNPAALFPYTSREAAAPLLDAERVRPLPTALGEVLPPQFDAAELGARAAGVLAAWPPGTFDSTVDLEPNPVRIPPAFTFRAQPYGWSGTAAIGPFSGLSAMTSMAHGTNADPTLYAELSLPLFGIGRKAYLRALLANAADRVKGRAGVLEAVPGPGHPSPNYLSPTGSYLSSRNRLFWAQANAMAAWQNSLMPPTPPVTIPPDRRNLGRRVFETAGCTRCHLGAQYTVNRVLPVWAAGTNPSRARAFSPFDRLLGPPLLWPFDALVPIRPDTAALPVPLDEIDGDQLRLAWAESGTDGGYKIPALVGLYWSAPFLHDGGVAVGADSSAGIGLPGTLLRGVPADPGNSLRALVDREIRRRVIRANRDAGLPRVHVEGRGHEFWVDREGGFSQAEQDTLIDFLLTL